MKLSFVLLAVAALVNGLPSADAEAISHIDGRSDADAAYDYALKAAQSGVGNPADIAPYPGKPEDHEKRQWGNPTITYGMTVTTTPCYLGPNVFLPALINFPPNTWVAITCRTNSGFLLVGGQCYTPWWNIPGVWVANTC